MRRFFNVFRESAKSQTPQKDRPAGVDWRAAAFGLREHVRDLWDARQERLRQKARDRAAALQAQETAAAAVGKAGGAPRLPRKQRLLAVAELLWALPALFAWLWAATSGARSGLLSACRSHCGGAILFLSAFAVCGAALLGFIVNDQPEWVVADRQAAHAPPLKPSLRYSIEPFDQIVEVDGAPPIKCGERGERCFMVGRMGLFEATAWALGGPPPERLREAFSAGSAQIEPWRGGALAVGGSILFGLFCGALILLARDAWLSARSALNPRFANAARLLALGQIVALAVCASLSVGFAKAAADHFSLAGWASERDMFWAPADAQREAALAKGAESPRWSAWERFSRSQIESRKAHGGLGLARCASLGLCVPDAWVGSSAMDAQARATRFGAQSLARARARAESGETMAAFILILFAMFVPTAMMQGLGSSARQWADRLERWTQRGATWAEGSRIAGALPRKAQGGARSGVKRL